MVVTSHFSLSCWFQPMSCSKPELSELGQCKCCHLQPSLSHIWIWRGRMHSNHQNQSDPLLQNRKSVLIKKKKYKLVLRITLSGYCKSAKSFKMIAYNVITGLYKQWPAYIHFQTLKCRKALKEISIFSTLSMHYFTIPSLFIFIPKNTSSNSLKRCLRVNSLALSWTKNYF